MGKTKRKAGDVKSSIDKKLSRSSTSSNNHDAGTDVVEELFKEASTLFASNNVITAKMDSVLTALQHNVQDYKSMNCLDNFKKSMHFLSKAVADLEDSRKRYGESKIFLLPAEMIDRLMKDISFEDKMNLRLVSKPMYHLVTPRDHRFNIWNIDLNRKCLNFGEILNKSPNTEIHVTLPKSRLAMAKYVPHLEKASDRIVEIEATSPVIREQPNFLKMLKQLEKCSISFLESNASGKIELGYRRQRLSFLSSDSEEDDYSKTPPKQNYNDVVLILQQNSTSLKTLYLSRFVGSKLDKIDDFELSVLQELHFSNYNGNFDLASDFIVSKCKASLQSLTLSDVVLFRRGKKPEEITKLEMLKKLTVKREDFCLSWSLPAFLKYVCPGITELVLTRVHFPDEIFNTTLVIEKMNISNCRIDNISSLLNACSSTLINLHIRQDLEFDYDKIIQDDDWEYDCEMNDGPFCLIKSMLKQDFKLRRLQHLTLMTEDFSDAQKMSIDFGSKLPAGVTIQIESPYDD